MKINLQQTEIVVALKEYIERQGFAIAGKDVKITFTAGRKDAGLTADLSIEDIAIPGAEGFESEKPALSVVAAPAAAALAPVTTVAVKEAPAANETAAAESTAVQTEDKAEAAVSTDAAPVKTTTTSLFG